MRIVLPAYLRPPPLSTRAAQYRLPRLPAAGDNAAMHAKRIRRSLQFGLQILLCLTALGAVAADSLGHHAAKDPELQSELLRRTKVDQDARIAITNWLATNGANGALDPENQTEKQKAEFEKLATTAGTVDRENTTWLKEVVENRGWPTITLVGQDGAKAAWLLVQHADADPKFQRKCLDLMAKLPKAEASQTDIVYLTDRVLLAEGKKQVYGTQFHMVNGKLQPRPLDDEASVDKLRASVGLPPLAEYAKEMAKVYGGNSN